jgi:hypothetical protein
LADAALATLTNGGDRKEVVDNEFLDDAAATSAGTAHFLPCFSANTAFSLSLLAVEESDSPTHSLQRSYFTPFFQAEPASVKKTVAIVSSRAGLGVSCSGTCTAEMAAKLGSLAAGTVELSFQSARGFAISSRQNPRNNSPQQPRINNSYKSDCRTMRPHLMERS